MPGEWWGNAKTQTKSGGGVSASAAGIQVSGRPLASETGKLSQPTVIGLRESISTRTAEYADGIFHRPLLSNFSGVVPAVQWFGFRLAEPDVRGDIHIRWCADGCRESLLHRREEPPSLSEERPQPTLTPVAVENWDEAFLMNDHSHRDLRTRKSMYRMKALHD